MRNKEEERCDCATTKRKKDRQQISYKKKRVLVYQNLMNDIMGDKILLHSQRTVMISAFHKYRNEIQKHQGSKIT